MAEILKLVEFDERPWGSYTTTDSGFEFKTKTIVVNPGESLSKQYHNHREEHWIVVCGYGTMELNDKSFEVTKGKYIHIPKKAVHRIRNTSPQPLVFCEIQLGDYLMESDIVRLDDDYGRVDG